MEARKIELVQSILSIENLSLLDKIMGRSESRYSRSLKYEVYIRDEAEMDIKAAIDWYETETEGLGKSFATKLSDGMDVIRKIPICFL